VRDARLINDAEQLRVATELRFRLAFEGNLAPMTVTNPDDQISAATRPSATWWVSPRENSLGTIRRSLPFPMTSELPEESHRRAISGETSSRDISRDICARTARSSSSRCCDRQRATKRANFSISSSPSVTSPRRRRCPLKITHQSLHRSLTGLANRAASLWTGSPKGMARSVRKGGTGAVLLLDLDNFQGVQRRVWSRHWRSTVSRPLRIGWMPWRVRRTP